MRLFTFFFLRHFACRFSCLFAAIFSRHFAMVSRHDDNSRYTRSFQYIKRRHCPPPPFAPCCHVCFTSLFVQAYMLPLLQRPSLKDILRHTREAAVCEMDLSHQRVMRDGGVLRIQPLQACEMDRSALYVVFFYSATVLCCPCVCHGGRSTQRMNRLFLLSCLFGRCNGVVRSKLDSPLREADRRRRGAAS